MAGITPARRVGSGRGGVPADFRSRTRWEGQGPSPGSELGPLGTARVGFTGSEGRGIGQAQETAWGTLGPKKTRRKANVVLLPW